MADEDFSYPHYIVESDRGGKDECHGSVLQDNPIMQTGYLRITDLGSIPRNDSIAHGSILTYNKHLKQTMDDIELCWLFSLSEEFKFVTVRQDEKTELEELRHHVLIPIKESLEEPRTKVNVLVQAYISQLEIEGSSLKSDMKFVTETARPLMRALFMIVLKRGWAELTILALKWCKMIDKRMWVFKTPLRQFHGVPNESLMKLEKEDLAWDRYYDLSAQEIGELVRCPKMGRTLHKLIHQIPKLNLAAHVQPLTRSVLKVELTITPDFHWEDKVHGFVEPFWVIVENNDKEYILHHEYFLLNKQYIKEDHHLTFTVPIYEPVQSQYFIRVISDRWIGSETVYPVSFRDLILPVKDGRPDNFFFDPMPVTALRNPSYEALYQELKEFNSVQASSLRILYKSDDNALVAAPTGSGKTICAEFAILRNHKKGSDSMRVVYIAPVEAVVKQRFSDWSTKFGDGLQMRVVELTGDKETDLKLSEKGQIIVSTPEKWDVVSRCWKQMNHGQKVSLFIADELHLIGGQKGPIFEMILSRMRFIASKVKHKMRFVALSTSLAHARDLANWIGAEYDGIVDLSSGFRPFPTDVHIQGIDIANFEPRMEAMKKPSYHAIFQHARNSKPVIVFVPTREHVCLTAEDLKKSASSNSGNTPIFLQCSVEELQPFVDNINEDALKETLRYGIGYIHEGLTSTDQDKIKTLFESGIIRVCVMTGTMCWGVPLTAPLVVVMGTQCYDSIGNVESEYPVTDLLQMMGHARHPVEDNLVKCLIFCHAPRKEYYKKFLYEAFPVESHVHNYIHDILNSEITAGIIQNKEDAMDYLTWTFMYKRLTSNPNYYGLNSVKQLSDHLLELVENTLADLEACKCVAIKEGILLSPLYLGIIATKYYIRYTTIGRFSSSLTQETKLKGVLDILASATEYEHLPIRRGEDELIKRLINHQRFSFENPKYTDPHVKAKVLLQAHFSRHILGGNLALDQQDILSSANRLLQAMVDVISWNGWLSSTLLLMKMSQMVTQGMWEHDSMLLQLPHFTKELAKRCHKNPKKSIYKIFDLVELEDDERRELLKVSDTQLMDIDRFCNRFLNMDFAYDLVYRDSVTPGEAVRLQVTLNRVLEGRTEVGAVDAPRFPKVKEEGWWLVVGDTKNNHLLAIERVTLQRNAQVKLSFTAPAEPGTKSYTLYFMCDSYMGCDQECRFTVDVKEPSTP